jgi:hypothetical protein
MKQLNTTLMNQPLAYQCSFRINELCSYYGKLNAYKTMLSPRRIMELSDLSELERHVSNLYITVGHDCYFDVFNIIFNKELKKVG